MIRKLSEVYANEDFQKSPYEEQRRIKAALFESGWKDDPALKDLTPEERQYVFQRYVDSPPAVRGFNPYTDITDVDRFNASRGMASSPIKASYIEAYDLVDRLERGDPEAVTGAGWWVTRMGMANESLLMKAMAGIDYVGSQLAGNDDPLPMTWDQRAVSEMSDYLLSRMETADRAKAQSRAGWGKLAVGLAENIVLTNILVGSGNVVKAGQALGQSAGIVGRPGIFTTRLFGAKGAFTALANAAQTPAARTIWTKWAPMLTEAVGGGLVDVARRLPDLVYEGKLEGPKAFWGGLASSFGQGVAWDLGTNMALDVAKHVLRPFARTFRKFALGKSLDYDELLAAAREGDAVDQETLVRKIMAGKLTDADVAGLSPEIRAGVMDTMARSQVLAQVREFNPRNPQALGVLAKAIAGVDLELDNGIYRLVRDGEVLGTARNQASVIDTLTDLARSRGSADMEVVGLGAGKAAGWAGSARGSVTRGFYQLDEKAARAVARNVDDLVKQVPFGTPDLELLSKQGKGVAQRALELAGVSADDAARIAADFPVPPKFDGTGESYFGFMRSWLTSKAPSAAIANRIPDLAGAYRKTGQSVFGFDSMRAVVEGRLGGQLRAVSDGLEASLPDPRTGGMLKVKGSNLRDLNFQLADFMVDHGLIEEEEFANQLRKQAGIVMERAKDGTFVLRTASGNTIGGPLASLKEVSDYAPEFKFRLPEYTAPEFFFDGATTYTSRTFATGPMDHIRRVMDNFSYKTDPLEFHYVNEAGVSISSSRTLAGVELEIPGVGLKKRFSTFDEASKFVREQADSYDTLKSIAAERGFRLDATGADLVATAGDGRRFIFRDKKGLEAFLSEAPDPAFAPTLVDSGFASSLDESVVAGAQARLGGTLKEFGDEMQPIELLVEKLNAYRHRGLQAMTRDLDLFVSEIGAPRFSTIGKLAEATGDRELAKRARDWIVTRRIADQVKFKARSILERIGTPLGKKLKREEAFIIKNLLSAPESQWDTIARKLYSKADLRRVKLAASGIKALIKSVGDDVGIDGMLIVTHYVPQSRNISATLADLARSGKTLDAAAENELLARLLPSGTKEFEWAARQLRVDGLAEMGQSDDIIEIVSRYIDAAYTDKYQRGALDAIQGYLKTPGKDPRALRVMKGLYDLATGSGKTAAESNLEMFAAKVSSAISETMNKHTPELFGEKLKLRWKLLAKSMVTTDPISKFSSAMSYALLGGRPWRQISNWMQFTQNALPLYGKTIVDRAIDETGDDFIRRLADEGILTKNIFSATDSGSVGGQVKELMMRGQQNAEYMTRAYTAKAVDITFDEAIQKYAAGTIDEQGVLAFTKANILDTDQQIAFLQALKQGDFGTAKKGLMGDMVNLLMGDYSRENHSEVARGVIGRLFGKFGVYPAAQIDLMRRIYKNSSSRPLERLANFAKFVGTSYAIYNGFRAVGINYSGFKFYDPLTFSGGPGFGLAIDALQAGKALSNPSDQRAQASLRDMQRNLLPFVVGSKNGAPTVTPNIPRLLVPGGLQWTSVQKGFESWANADWWQGTMQMFGAPVYEGYQDNGFTWGW